MALIKCSECGRMVSDKATACPHCGCPVKRQLVCPECGEAVSERDSYCLKCGCPLNHNPQSQVEEQTDYSWDYDEKKPNNTLKWLLGVLAAVIVFGGIGLYAWQSGMFETPTDAVDTVAVDSTPQMIAPVINLDANGMYTIDDCPTTYEGLEIIRNYTSNGCLMSVVVNRDGNHFQTLNIDTSFDDFKDVVHFLDANFDGFVDFMLGTGDYGENSILFLWSPEESKFVTASIEDETVISGLGNYGFSFNPKTQKVYCSGNLVDVEKKCQMIWKNSSLINEEELMEIFDKSQLSDYNCKNRYTLIQTSTNRVLVSTDNPNELPERWRKVAHILTPKEEAEYSQSDAEWLQGTWRCKGLYQGTHIDVVLDIQGNRLIEKWNGEVQYDGSFDYVPSQNMIVYDDGKSVLSVIPEQQVIKLIDDLYFSKSGTGDISTSNSSRRSSSTRAQARRLEESVQGDIDDLYFMAKTGNMNPANIMFIKQNLPGQIRELIDLYRQENNSEKVNEWTYKLDAVESVLSQIRM